MELFEVCPCGTPLKSLTDPIGICPECYVRLPGDLRIALLFVNSSNFSMYRQKALDFLGLKVWRRAFVPEPPVPVLDPGWDKVEKD